eukprot:TRINITY_DN74336_c0_g1_i1.p1 TRINITY_DN74336_c0_g1~~TRINITY_DN74336_c0_g1_i1.p1  ORF type:complete len:579 (+),score=110.20 TRINITY_DN74336_c0_g1_i1:52-1788(+)
MTAESSAHASGRSRSPRKKANGVEKADGAASNGTVNGTEDGVKGTIKIKLPGLPAVDPDFGVKETDGALQFFHAADPRVREAMYVCPLPSAGRGPLLLQSHGWFDGHLMEDYKPENFDHRDRRTWPLVRAAGSTHFATRDEPKARAPSLEQKRIHPRNLRKPRKSHQPLMSMVFVRWGGYDAVHEPDDADMSSDGGWGMYGSPACDTYMHALLSEGVFKHPKFREDAEVPYDLEVFSLFIKNSSDIQSVEPAAPWIASCLRGKKRASFWMMWPAEWEDTRGADYAAYIERHAMFGAMRALESEGIPTGFPHPADQYELMTSKSWMATLSLQAEAKLPAATMLSKAAVLADADGAAKKAMSVLNFIRSKNPFAEWKGGQGPSVVNKDGVHKGVVKLGWSWEARYVTIFRGEEDLAAKLREMMTTAGCLASSCIVQEWVDFDFEMRLYFLPPDDWTPDQKLKPAKIECNAWSGSMENGQRRKFHILTDETILEKYWKDDPEALKSARKQALATAQFLLHWLLLSNAITVPMVRLDFMCGRAGKGEVQVAFGEYCEMGACCLGWENGPPTIWKRAIDAVLR